LFIDATGIRTEIGAFSGTLMNVEIHCGRCHCAVFAMHLFGGRAVAPVSAYSCTWWHTAVPGGVQLYLMAYSCTWWRMQFI
jgi:hypothetical protein